MKRRGFYIAASVSILLVLISSCFFIAFGNQALFYEKNGSLSLTAILILCACIFFSVCDIALFLFTKEGCLTFKQSFQPQGTILVYLTATILITALVSYFSIFCVNTISNSTHTTNPESIVDMISST
jgi:hypothetical protein